LSWAEQGEIDNGEDAEDVADISLLRLQAQLLFSLKRYAEAAAMFGRVGELERWKSGGSGEKDSGAAWLMQGYAAWNGELWQQARQAFHRAERYPAQRKRAQKLLNQLSAISATSVAH